MSSDDSLLNDFIESNDITLQQILNNLLDGSKDLELKTHIFKPKQLASLMILSDYSNGKELTKVSNLIDNFVNNYYLRYMVSFKRLSRTEIIKAISNLRDDLEGLNTTQKLTTNLSK